jgi:hypothetical protein
MNKVNDLEVRYNSYIYGIFLLITGATFFIGGLRVIIILNGDITNKESIETLITGIFIVALLFSMAIYAFYIFSKNGFEKVVITVTPSNLKETINGNVSFDFSVTSIINLRISKIRNKILSIDIKFKEKDTTRTFSLTARGGIKNQDVIEVYNLLIDNLEDNNVVVSDNINLT